MGVYVGTTGDDVADGTNAADQMTGGRGDDHLSGLDGADRLRGGEGDDTLIGGAGRDSIEGGEGDDEIFVSDTFGSLDPESNLANGGSGNDRIYGQAGDTLNGGDGIDLAWVRFHGDANVRLDLRGVASGSDVVLEDGTTLSGFERIDVSLGAGDDVVRLAESMSGNAVGGGGDDTLLGGAGNDTLGGADGADRMDGGAGDDQLGGDADDRMIGGEGDDSFYSSGGGTLSGGAGVDTFELYLGDIGHGLNIDMRAIERASVEIAPGMVMGKLETGVIYLGDGDLFQGHAYSVMITDGAGGGDDTLRGGTDDDTLDGGSQHNLVSGGRGDDVLNTGRGHDDLTGGLGADVFYFHRSFTAPGKPATATITDFGKADTVDLSVYASSLNPVEIVAKFTGESGQAVVKYNAERDVTVISVDDQGDQRPDLILTVAGDHRDLDGFFLG